MRRLLVKASFTCSLVTATLAALAVPSLRAQSSSSPIRHALYLALGGDPFSGNDYANAPRAVSAGVERSRDGSRWSMRLGADYRRQSSDGVYGKSRLEDFGANLLARYGRASGSIRPYVLGGVGGAQLRMRVRDARYYADSDGALFPPQSYDLSRWAGSLTTGFGTDVDVGRLRLFSEARLTSHMNVFHPTRGAETRKALFFGIKL